MVVRLDQFCAGNNGEYSIRYVEPIVPSTPRRIAGGSGLIVRVPGSWITWPLPDKSLMMKPVGFNAFGSASAVLVTRICKVLVPGRKFECMVNGVRTLWSLLITTRLPFK